MRSLLDRRRTPIQLAEYEIETLTERIAENEVYYGPGCRPELRARLRDAKRHLAYLHRQNELRILEGREVRPIRVTPEGKLHADDDFGQPECGADGDGVTWETSPFSTTNARSFIGRSDSCGRCIRSLEAWAKED